MQVKPASRIKGRTQDEGIRKQGTREIFGHKMEEETVEWGKMCHVVLPQFYGSPDIIKVNKSGRLR
jgi:hypothetical protein